MRHIALGAPAHKAENKRRALAGFGIIAALALVAVALQSFQYLVFAVVILVANSFIELHKHFTYGIPIDLELLTVGVAYLGAHKAYLPALLLVLFGALIAELARGHFSRAVFLRPLTLLPVMFVAAALGPTTFGLLAAVFIGVIGTFIRVLLTARFYMLYTVFARVTQFALAAYVVLFVLPVL